MNRAIEFYVRNAYSSTYHQKSLTQGTGTLSQNLVSFQWNNVAQGENERVDIFHVEVICSHGIGDGVLRESLRLFHRVTEDCVKSVVGNVEGLYSRRH